MGAELAGQCKVAGVPFFFKQVGEWAPVMEGGLIITTDAACQLIDRNGAIVGRNHAEAPRPFALMQRIGKARSGHLLDGVEHHEFPKAESEAQS